MRSEPVDQRVERLARSLSRSRQMGSRERLVAEAIVSTVLSERADPVDRKRLNDGGCAGKAQVRRSTGRPGRDDPNVARLSCESPSSSRVWAGSFEPLVHGHDVLGPKEASGSAGWPVPQSASVVAGR